MRYGGFATDGPLREAGAPDIGTLAVRHEMAPPWLAQDMVLALAAKTGRPHSAQSARRHGARRAHWRELTVRRHELNPRRQQASDAVSPSAGGSRPTLPPLLDKYKKWAAAEGAGTGAGGLILAAVDFPALISIKLKFLQEVALLYGFDIRDKSERVFLLHVFQLAFSSPERRQANFEQVKQWEKTALETRQTIAESIAWRDFYMDYKQYIEFRKLLQILPGIGAVIGAWANHSLMDDLGKTAQNAFRLRYLQKKYGLDMPSYADKGTSNNGP